MKKKMAIILALVIACSMSMTAMAAPSPSIVQTPVAQVVVGTTTESGSVSAIQPTAAAFDQKSAAVLEGTVFRTADNQVVDQSSVAMVIQPATQATMTAAANSLAAAMSPASKNRVMNLSGREQVVLTDSTGALNLVNQATVSLQTASGSAVGHNQSVSAVFNVSKLIGTRALAANETVQAVYQRADGTWVVLPVVIIGDCLAVGIPAFAAGGIQISFVVTQGVSYQDVIVPKKSPNT